MNIKLYRNQDGGDGGGAAGGAGGGSPVDGGEAGGSTPDYLPASRFDEFSNGITGRLSQFEQSLQKVNEFTSRFGQVFGGGSGNSAPKEPDMNDPKYKSADGSGFTKFLNDRDEWRDWVRENKNKATAQPSGGSGISQADIAKAEETFEDNLDEYIKDHPEYHKDTQNAQIRVPAEVFVRIKKSADGPAIIHHLAKNPDAAARVSKAARRDGPMGAIEEIAAIRHAIKNEADKGTRDAAASQPPRMNLRNNTKTNASSKTIQQRYEDFHK